MGQVWRYTPRSSSEGAIHHCLEFPHNLPRNQNCPPRQIAETIRQKNPSEICMIWKITIILSFCFLVGKLTPWLTTADSWKKQCFFMLDSLITISISVEKGFSQHVPVVWTGLINVLILLIQPISHSILLPWIWNLACSLLFKGLILQFQLSVSQSRRSILISGWCSPQCQ